MREFLSIHNILSHLAWSLLMAGIIRAIMWAFRQAPPRQLRFWIVMTISCFCLLMGLQYATVPSAAEFRLEFIRVNVFESGGAAGIAPVVRIYNTGGPSVAVDWEFAVTVPGGTPRMGSPISIADEGFVLTNEKGQSVKYLQRQALYLKTATPLQKGGMEEGILDFAFPEIPRPILLNANTEMTIAVLDAAGHRFSTSTTIGELKSGLKFDTGWMAAPSK